MCGAPAQARSLPAGTDLATQTVLVGKVLSGGHPVGGAFVRLLDATGEFTAEVVSSACGDFRFFSAPGPWRLRVLSRSGAGDALVDAPGPGLHEVDVHLA